MSSFLCRQFQITALASALLTAPAVVGACFAQEAQGGNVTSLGRVFQSRGGTAIDLDFRGGTATEFIDAVRKAADGKVNIVAMPYVEEVRVPPMKLKSVDVISAVNLLDGESLQTPSRLVRLDVRIIAPASGELAALVKVNADVKQAGGFAPPQRSNIWSVADLMSGGMTAEHITTAVSAALELMDADAAKAQVRFHKETSLLLARAEPEQIGIIHDVIAQLRESSAQQQAEAMKPLRSGLEQLEQRLNQSEVERRTLQAEASERLQMAEAIKVRAEAMERRTAELEALCSRLRDELMQRESMVRALEMELAELQKQLKKAQGGG